MKNPFGILLSCFLSLQSFNQTPGIKWSKYIQKSLCGQGFYDAKATPAHQVAQVLPPPVVQHHWLDLHLVQLQE